jgi:hypothetical protein
MSNRDPYFDYVVCSVTAKAVSSYLGRALPVVSIGGLARS